MKIYDILFGKRPKSIGKIIEEGNLEELKIFKENGGDINSRYDDRSLLHFAIDNCQNNYFDVIDFLINNGAEINNYQSSFKETPLHRACARSKPDIDVVKLLLDKGAEVNFENISGKTPIFYCNFSYSIELLTLLIKYRADIKHTDKYNNTLLHDDFFYYYDDNFEEYLKMLISFGIDINAENNVSHTPLFLCKNKKIQNILIKYGAIVSGK